MGQRNGTLRAEIAGHGQYETTFQAFEAVQEMYAGDPLRNLYRYLKEDHGDPEYDTSGLTRTECLMILQELRGHATN
jgi:hypothetical protein